MSVNHPKAFLIILDGYGLRDQIEGNAPKLADTPYLHKLFKEPIQGSLKASGRNVGLPQGLMGNSEVGHLNLGAGRIVFQEISRIDNAIETGEFFSNTALVGAVEHAKQNNSDLHLIGLVSDGGVHSSMEHLYALLELAQRHGLKRVYLHALTDGRDTSPHGAREYIRQVEEKMVKIGVGKTASVCGRYWMMDRDKRWERVERGYRLLTEGEGLPFKSAPDAVEDSYKREVTDEFIEPSVIVENDKPLTIMKDGDAVIFFNFRADRAREITWALTEPEFEYFKRKKLNVHYTTLTIYHEDMKLPVAFPPHHLKNILGEVVSAKGLKQFRIAETEKYAHVTFFFNGGEETPFSGEERKLIPSPKVPTYDMQPEMSAEEVAHSVLDILDKDYSFILLNFANPDMVGHTGVLAAAVKALETLDPLVEKIITKALKQEYSVMVTADHGNCEQMIAEDGSPHTAHTTNRVPFVLLKADGSRPALRQDGILADVAPTLLELMDIPKPEEMTGKTLIIH